METNSIYKGSLYLSNMEDSGFRTNTAPYPLLHFEYKLSRHKNEEGESAEHILGDFTFTIKVGDTVNVRTFISTLLCNQEQAFTILFNDVLESRKVSDYRNGLILTGFVYDVDDSYKEDRNELTLKVNPLSVNFLGEDSSKELQVWED